MNEVLLNSILNGSMTSDSIIPHEEQEMAFEKVSQVLIKNGTFQPADSKTLREQFTHKEIQLFMNKIGMYVLPTSDLIEDLKTLIPNLDTAIEIGSGNGVIANNLGIRATDNFMQRSDFKAPSKLKDLHKQFLNSVPMVQYGPNVLKVEAHEAVKRFKPKTVLACFVTHLYKQSEPERQGNALGVDYRKIIKSTDRVVLVGNDATHRLNPAMELPLVSLQVDSLITRSKTPDLNRIYIWDKKLLELEGQPERSEEEILELLGLSGESKMLHQ